MRPFPLFLLSLFQAHTTVTASNKIYASAPTFFYSEFTLMVNSCTPDLAPFSPSGEVPLLFLPDTMRKYVFLPFGLGPPSRKSPNPQPNFPSTPAPFPRPIIYGLLPYRLGSRRWAWGFFVFFPPPNKICNS